MRSKRGTIEEGQRDLVPNEGHLGAMVCNCLDAHGNSHTATLNCY